MDYSKLLRIFSDKLTEANEIYVNEKLKELGFDKTKRGRVTSVNGTISTVEIDGEEYNCKLRRGIYVEPNDIVFVKFPQDSSVDRYVDAVLGGNETPEGMVISAQEILDKLKTVDGEGSGLDADLLDGKHANEFATLDDLEDIDVDISGEAIVININESQSIIDDKNLSENVNDAIDKKHSHANKSIIDNINQDDVDTWYTVINKSDKTYVDNKLGDKVDRVEGKGLSEESYSASEKSKLAGIETEANKYIHPDTHPANIIEQNSNNRFTTDVEKANWNAKETTTGAQAKANVAESNAKTYTDNHIADNTKHISSNERNLWNTVEGKVDKITGKQLSDESYTLIEKNKLSGIEAGANKYTHPNTHSLDIITETTAKKIMTSTERDKLAGISNNANKVESSLINGNIKIDNVEKNVYTHPSGTNPHGTTKSDIGLGDVENKSSATIRGEITISNITDALGYTPENSLNKGVANGYAPLDSNIKIPLSILPDIAKQQTYVVGTLVDRNNLTSLIMGEKCYVTSTGDSYIWDGDSWEILAKADWENVNLQWTNIVGKPSSNVLDIDDATSKRHTHSNKSIIDTVTQTLIDRWNSAWTHISDTIKHITSAERTKWNTVDNKADTTYVNTELNKKVDKVAGKQLSTEDYTTTEKNKLSGIESGANKYILPVATENIIGGVKAGSNLSVSDDGTLHANDNPSSFIVKQEMFVVEEGQTVFNLVQGNYKPNTNTISVYIYGGKQPNITITELSSTSFRINEPLEDGAVILVEYFEIINTHPYPHHAHEHLTDGVDAIPKTTNTQDGLMSKEDKIKLTGIEAGANKYTHPSTHPASMIVESTTKRFVSDSEKSTWNTVTNKTDKTYVDGELQKYVPLSGNSVISGTKTFTDVLKNNGVENFNDVYIKKTLGRANVGTTYANLDSEIKTGGYHRFWKIAFPSGTNFWGKVKISLYGTYSSFNASGKMAKEINVNFNGASMYSNVGCYTELSGFVEKDFRISEAIWNPETSQWEFWIYSHQLQGNNTPYLYIEGWANGTNYMNTFNGITFNEAPVFLQDTTYENAKGNSAGQNLIKSWADLPTYQNPYGNTIASLDDLPTNLSNLTKDINFDERYYTETETNNLLNNKVDNSRVLSDVPLNAKFTDTNTTYSEITTAEIDAGTSSTLRTITARRIKYALDKVTTMISALTKSDIGLGNVDNKSSATIRGEITKANITSSLGYTPIKDGGSTPELRSGVESARPSATGSGIVYLATDTQKIYKDTASGKWTQMGGQDLPMASDTILGGIKVGANLTIAADGTLSAADSDERSTFIAKQEVFIATEGQTVFNLTKGNYKPNTNTISVYLYGGKQPNTIIDEISSTSFKITLPLKSGDIVIAEYIELSSATPYPIHGSDHLLDGYDPIPLVTTSKEGLMSKDDKSKLDDIENGANNYTHPSTHPASIITESSSRRFVSDTEKTTWNTVVSKADKDYVDTELGKKVDNSRVLTDVPLNAKFTDTNTTYSEISTAEIDAGTSSTLRTVTGRRVKYILDKVQEWIGGLTKSDVGLSNVDNIKQATKAEFDSHHSDTTKHILSTERTNWNAKETTTGSQNKANQAEQNAKDYTDGKVLTDVPLNAKFTDTVYSHPSTHPASMITESTSRMFVSDIEKTKWNAVDDKADKVYVDNIEVGGRNYFSNSDFREGMSVYWQLLNSSPSSNFEIVGSELKVTFNPGTKSDFGTMNFLSQNNLEGQDYITVSSLIRGNGTLRIRFGASTMPMQTVNNEQFKRVVFTIPRSNFGNGNLILEVASGTLYFYKIKAETGNKATDWTPSPEEVEGLIDGKADKSQVLTNVPLNAKFTDTNTTYSEITTTEIDTGTSATLRTITGRRVKYISDKIISIINNLTKADIGLGNVDNTSDLSKPISTATQTALNGKVNNNQVLTNVPTEAKFTDTITTVNNKTGAISKADIIALGIPAQDTVYTHPSNHPASMITESTTKRFVSDAEKNNWDSKAEISDIPTKVGQLENDKSYVTQDDLGTAGYGDMTKGVYDTNNNGKVDIAEVAETVIGNEIQLGGRFKIVYNDIEDSLDIEVI